MEEEEEATKGNTWWIFFRRMMVIMAALGSNWEEGSGKIKGRGERPGGEAAQGFYLAWGLHGSGRSWSNEANPGSSCGVWCECLRAGTLTIAGVSFLISPFTTLQNDNQNNSTVLNQSLESSFQVFPNLSADMKPPFASLWVGNEFQKIPVGIPLNNTSPTLARNGPSGA